MQEITKKQIRHMKKRHTSFHQWLLFIEIYFCYLKINPLYAILHIKKREEQW